MIKKIFFVHIALVMLLYVSCKKELSAPPTNAKTLETAILDQATAQIALNGAYFRFAHASSTSTAGWVLRHEVMGGQLTGNLDYAYGSMINIQNNNLMGSGLEQVLWDDPYLAINAANGVITGVGQLSPNLFTGSRGTEMMAEARFIRGYEHFSLLTNFGQWFDYSSALGILIRDRLSTLSNLQKARSSVKECYDFILADLDYAIANAPTNNPNHYVNKAAAMAVKMRVLMCRAQPGDYGNVISLANTIIALPNYGLEPNLKDIFYSKGLSSKEVILGIKPQTGQQLLNTTKTRYYFDGSGVYAATKRFKDDFFNPADSRLTWMIGPAVTGRSVTPNLFYLTKYAPAVANAGTALSETAYVIRLSEVYLLQAEAILRSGGDMAAARALITSVMDKTGSTAVYSADLATNDRDELLRQNYYEISRNLISEDNIEYLALLRFPLSMISNTPKLKPAIKSNLQYIFPIPTTEFLANPSIGPQNPGYGI